MVPANQFQIELVYINPPTQHVQHLNVTAGDTIEKVIKDSGVLSKFPELDFTVNKIGIYNKLVDLEYLLQEGDRLEIYRPLKIDPKEARRKRAEKR